VAPRRRPTTDCAKCAQPFAGAWASGANHHQKIRPTGHEHLQNLGEGEQLATNLMDVLAGARDLNPMGLHVGSSDEEIYDIA
jgi:hypothetical protein